MSAPIPVRSPSSLCKKKLALLLIALLFLPGCASKYGKQTTSVNHYPDCYAPINELRKNEFYAQKATIGGAAAGAVVGGLIGYLVTGKTSGVVVGSGVGGTLGVMAGGIYGQHQKEQNDQARLASYNALLESNIREVDKATAAAKVARQCYERQFTVAASEFKAGHITREQFNSRYQEIVQGLGEAANILGEANRYSAQVAQAYSRAVDEESQHMAQSKQTLKESRKTARASSSSSSISSGEMQQVAQLRSGSGRMQASVSAGQEEERLLRQRLTATHQQARDLMS